MPKSKKFINRKNAVTFHLVHRSQQDPLAADEDAPQHVLLPAGERQKKSDLKKRKEELQKYGIFYDDDYDYMQHLRESSTVQPVSWEKAPEKTNVIKNKLNENVNIDRINKLNLPKNVFASEKEEKVGLLNKAAPQGLNLDLDPDIVMALDDDFDFDDPNNELEDNFIEMANAPPSESEDYDEDRSDLSSDINGYTSEEGDEVRSLKGTEYTFHDEETKSRFTEYSMSSSVMRRNEQLSLVDKRFEQMFSEYDENEIGALDTDEIEGFVDPNSELMMQCADEFEKMKARKQLENEAIQFHTRKPIDVSDESDSDEADLRMMDITEKENEKWDCESILTTYSNLYNHPKLISEPKSVNTKIKISKKTGVPLDTLNSKNTLTAKALARLDAEHRALYPNGPKSCAAESVMSRLSTLSIRNKNETPEEKRMRKAALKEYRKERRLEKKANTIAFKEEKKRQEKIIVNNQVNLQGIK